jgi:hypothetical protein
MLGEPENVGIILTRVWNACKAQEVKESRPRASLNQEPVSETWNRSMSWGENCGWLIGQIRPEQKSQKAW